ncbi:MAG TPA: MarR family transcriptional regulator [Vicinamibacteria bacterium]|nr:MarR family transcriptional regulator [Vicinamibacteria bacterium]
MSPIQDEIQQSKPFAGLEDEVLISLLRTADVALRPLAEVLKAEGLSHTQYNVLRILRGAGAGGLSCREVGERMVTREPDLTRLLDRLEKRGLIARGREARDRRVVVTRITREGLAVLERLDQPAAASSRQALGHLGPEGLRTLARLLDQVRARP